MKIPKHWLLLVGFTVFVGLLGFVGASSGSEEPQAAVAKVHHLEHRTTVLEPLADAQPPLLGERTSFVLDVMGDWPHATVPAADYADVARDIATAAWAPDDAVLLAGLAFWEGARFAASVDDGRTNNPTWRASAEGRRTMQITGDGDGGRAWTLWQIHPIVDRASRMYALCSPDVVTGSRVDAARCALALAKGSLGTYGSLCSYTGEPCYGDHPAADKRLAFVRAALARHPVELRKE